MSHSTVVRQDVLEDWRTGSKAVLGAAGVEGVAVDAAGVGVVLGVLDRGVWQTVSVQALRARLHPGAGLGPLAAVRRHLGLGGVVQAGLVEDLLQSGAADDG